MGNLKPGAQYIYESPDNGNTVYAREVGTTEKTLVGYNYKNEKTRLEDLQLWLDIQQTAEENPTLKIALKQMLVVYNLSKDIKK